MPTPTIPDAIAALLPIIATALSRWLADDRFKPSTNALISGAALLFTALACWFLAGNFTGNWQASILTILAYVAFLMKGDLALLLQFFDLAGSPLAHTQSATSVPVANTTQGTIDIGQASTAKQPAAAPLPTTPVPPTANPQPLLLGNQRATRLPPRPPTTRGG